MLKGDKISQRRNAINEAKLSRRFYIPRIVSYLLLGSVLGSILCSKECSWFIWALALLNCFIWPHVALYAALKSRNPKKAEIKILLVDSLFGGLWLPVTSFNLIFGVVGFSVQGVNNISVGGIRQYIKGAVVYLIGILSTFPFTGFSFETRFNMLTLYSSGILYLIFPLVTGYVAYKLTQKLVIAKEKIKEKSAQMEGLAIKLAKYLSPQVYDSIFTGKKDVKIETYKRNLTVFFSDIVNFTVTAENMHQDDLTIWLNSYLNEMAEIALEHNGTVDKYIGDAVMIFYGDPESLGEKEDAVQCVMMAIKMINSVRETGMNIRIGINSGECTVGNFGSENRMDYTIVGGAVNLAARLEKSSEPGRILISQNTYELVKDKIRCEPRGKIMVKGIDKPVMTYWVDPL